MQTDRGELERVAEEIGLTPDAVELRKAFLEFTQSDSEVLSEVHAYMEGQRVDEVLAELFYAHLLQFPHLQRFIPDEHALERLKHSQARYFRRLTAGEYGDDYILDRLRVGMAHQRAGLETQWYIGAYRKYLSFYLATLNDMPGMDNEKFAASLEALMKVVFLDLGLALDTYFHRTRQELAFMANHDVLTGLPNRNLLHDRIEQALLQAHRSGEGVAIFLIDLDRFRNINDSLGHAVGDEVIVAVAGRLGRPLREDFSASFPRARLAPARPSLSPTVTGTSPSWNRTVRSWPGWVAAAAVTGSPASSRTRAKPRARTPR